MELKDFFGIFRRRWITGLVVVALFAGIGLALPYFQRREYEAEATLRGRLERVTLPAAGEGFLRANEPATLFWLNREGYLQSDSLREYAAAVFKVTTELERQGRGSDWSQLRIEPLIPEMEARNLVESVEWWDPEKKERLRNLQLNMDLLQSEKTDLTSRVEPARPDPRSITYVVKATSRDPFEAMRLVNSFAFAAAAFGGYEATRNLEVGYRRMSERHDEILAALEEQRRKIGGRQEFDRRNRDQGRLENQVLQLEEAEEEARQEIENLKRRVNRLVQAINLHDSGAAALASVIDVSSPMLQSLEGEIWRLETELTVKRIGWTEEFGPYREIEERLSSMRRSAEQERRRALAGEVDRLLDREGELEELCGRVSARAREMQQKVDVESRWLSEQGPEIALLERLEHEESELRDVLREFQTLIDQPHTFFDEPSYAGGATPKVAAGAKGLALWILLGLVCAAAASYARDYLDTTVRTDYDIRRHLNLPVLAILPRLGGDEAKLAAQASTGSPLMEMFSAAATVLRRGLREAGSGSLMISSAIPKEGKTTFSINLAVAFAKKGVKTLLVDTDLRRPEIHRLLNLGGGGGLAEFLVSDEPPAGFRAHVRPSGVEGLDVLPAGHHVDDPIRAIESARLKEAVALMKQEYEVVIFDSPPVTSVGDPLTIAGFADAVVLVVASGSAERQELSWCKHLLTNTGARILGACLNFAPKGGTTEYYYYYQYSYGPKRVHQRQ